jgi:hypothetical protein
MANVNGDGSFNGRIGDLIYYRDRNGRQIVKRAAGPSAQKIRTDPGFARVRENNEEFKAAVKLSKGIRDAFALPFPQKPSDGFVDKLHLHNRLDKMLFRMVKLDAVNPRGQRRIKGSTIGELRGLEWTKWEADLRLRPFTVVNEQSLTAKARIPQIPYGTPVRLALVHIPDNGEAPYVAQTVDTVFNDTDILILEVQLPTTGMWIAGMGYRIANCYEHGMCIVGAGGS